MPITPATLLQYLEAELRVRPGTILPDTPLFSSGLIDSLSMMELVVFIEQNSGIRVGATDLTLENVDSISRILDFVRRRSENR